MSGITHQTEQAWVGMDDSRIKRAINLLQITPQHGLLLDVANPKVQKILENFSKSKETAIAINDKEVLSCQFYLFKDQAGRVYINLTGYFAEGFIPQPIDSAYANTFRYYKEDNADEYVLVKKSRHQWELCDLSTIGDGTSALVNFMQLVYSPDTNETQDIGKLFVRKNPRNPGDTFEQEFALIATANKQSPWSSYYRALEVTRMQSESGILSSQLHLIMPFFNEVPVVVDLLADNEPSKINLADGPVPTTYSVKYEKPMQSIKNGQFMDTSPFDFSRAFSPRKVRTQSRVMDDAEDSKVGLLLAKRTAINSQLRSITDSTKREIKRQQSVQVDTNLPQELFDNSGNVLEAMSTISSLMKKWLIQQNAQEQVGFLHIDHKLGNLFVIPDLNQPDGWGVEISDYGSGFIGTPGKPQITSDKPLPATLEFMSAEFGLKVALYDLYQGNGRTILDACKYLANNQVSQVDWMAYRSRRLIELQAKKEEMDLLAAQYNTDLELISAILGKDRESLDKLYAAFNNMFSVTDKVTGQRVLSVPIKRTFAHDKDAVGQMATITRLMDEYVGKVSEVDEALLKKLAQKIKKWHMDASDKSALATVEYQKLSSTEEIPDHLRAEIIFTLPDSILKIAMENRLAIPGLFDRNKITYRDLAKYMQFTFNGQTERYVIATNIQLLVRDSIIKLIQELDLGDKYLPYVGSLKTKMPKSFPADPKHQDVVDAINLLLTIVNKLKEMREDYGTEEALKDLRICEQRIAGLLARNKQITQDKIHLLEPKNIVGVQKMIYALEAHYGSSNVNRAGALERDNDILKVTISDKLGNNPMEITFTKRGNRIVLDLDVNASNSNLIGVLSGRNMNAEPKYPPKGIKL